MTSLHRFPSSSAGESRAPAVALAAFLLGAALIGANLVAATVGPLPLIEAAKSGDKDAIRVLLQKGANVNTLEADGTTALHWVSYHDDLESAGALLRAGAKVNASNDLGATPLWAACQNGSAPMVRLLLAAGADPNLALLAGETPLMVASRGGYPAVVEQLIAKGANVNAHGARGQTALMWAAAQKHPEVVNVLLKHDAEVAAKSDTWSEVMAVPPHGWLDYNHAIPHGGETALMFAARVGDLESAKLLVAAGANVNDTDAWGVSATTLAAHSGFADTVEFLLAKNADPNAARAGFSALHEAIMRRDERIVAALLDHGADANAPLRTWTPTRRSSKDFNFAPELVGATPFWLAARFSEPAIMRLLIKHGADPLVIHQGERVLEPRGGSGFQHRKDSTTALMAATGMGGGVAWVQLPRAEREAQTLEAVKMIVDAGVDLNAVNTDGRTALDAAKVQGYASVIEYLTGKGAKPARPDLREPVRIEN